MITERQQVLQRPVPVEALDRSPRVSPGPQHPATSESPGWMWRVLMVLIGSGLAMIGWSLVMSVFLIFIGLPVFIFGLALMQAQES